MMRLSLVNENRLEKFGHFNTIPDRDGVTDRRTNR